MRRWTKTTALLLAVALGSSCTGAADDGTPEAQARGTRGATAVPEETGATAQARWLVRRLNSARKGLSATEVAARFGPDFAAEGMREQLDRTFAAVRGLGRSWQVVETSRDDRDSSVELVLATKDASRHLGVHLQVDDGGRLSMLQFGHAVDRGVDIRDSEAVVQEIAEVPAASSVVVRRGTEGCRPLGAQDVAADALPMASVAKLVLLATVLGEMERGKLYWEGRLPMIADARSLPATSLAEVAPGTEVTVRTLVEAMVTVSDNTAADLLLHHLGEEAVIRQWRQITGSRWEGRFWPTRELLLEGWGREAVPTVPRWHEGYDWFATGRQLCLLGVWLQDRREVFSEPLLKVIERAAQDAGFPGAWLFKRGGGPGVTAGLWLQRGPRRGVVVAQFAAEDVRQVADAHGLLWLAGGTMGDKPTRER